MEADGLGTIEFNLGFGIDHSFLDVVRIINEELGTSYKPIMVDVPIQIYAQKLLSSMTRTESVLRFRPQITLREGVGRIIQATKDLPADVRELLALDIAQHYYEKLEKRSMVPLAKT